MAVPVTLTQENGNRLYGSMWRADGGSGPWLIHVDLGFTSSTLMRQSWEEAHWDIYHAPVSAGEAHVAPISVSTQTEEQLAAIDTLATIPVDIDAQTEEP